MEANQELNEVQPQLRAHPAVLKLRYQVYADSKQWPMALLRPHERVSHT